MATKTSELTTARIGLINGKNELLTVKETKRKEHEAWNLPGGKKQDCDESLWETCRRECKEETGVDLPSEEPPVSFQLRGTGKVRVYVLKLETCPEATDTANDEISEVRWRKASELPGGGYYTQQGDNYQLKAALETINRLHTPGDAIEVKNLIDHKGRALPPGGGRTHAPPAKKQCTNKPCDDRFTNDLSAFGVLWLKNMSFSDFTLLHTANQCTHNDSDGTELKLKAHFEYVRQFTQQFSEVNFAELRTTASKLRSEKKEDWEITEALRRITVKQVQQYRFAQGRSSGRLFATGGGVQGFSKVVRAILTAHLTDFDMRNAHPTILLHLTKTQLIGLDPKHLQRYVMAREECLTEMMADDDISREDAKTMFLKSANKDKRVTRVGKRKVKNKFFCEFDAEVKQIQQKLYDMNKTRVPIHDMYNRKGKLVNFLMCEAEDELLRRKAFPAVEQLCQVQIPMFDGFMAKTKDSAAVLAALNKSTADSDVQWDTKAPAQIPFPPFEQVSVAQSTMMGDLHSVATQLLSVLRVCRTGNAFVIWTHDNRLVFDVTLHKREFADAVISEMFEHDIHVVSGADKHGSAIYSCLKARTGLDVQMSLVRLIVQMLPQGNLESDFWHSEFSKEDPYCKGILLWRDMVVYLSALNRCLLEKKEIGETEEMAIKECAHLLSQSTHVTIEQYLTSSRCRRYESDTFVPSLKYQGPAYNHFKGLAIQHKHCKDVSAADAEPWIKHVREIICDGSQENYEWVMNWLAAPLQAIESGDTEKVRQLATLFLIAGQGTGKGAFYHTIKTIYGQYYYYIEKKSDLHDRFNESLFHSLFVELDEVLFAGNHEQANELKALISGTVGTREEKMKKKRKNQPRWYNVAGATNSDHAAKAESDDRRNCFLAPSEEHSGRPQQDWAEHCRDVLQSDKVVRAVAKTLYEWPVPTDWIAQARIPQTQALIDQKEQSLTPLESVVKTWLENERILPTSIKIRHSGTDVCGFGDCLPRGLVYECARDQFKGHRGFPSTQQAFYTQLRRVFKKDMRVLTMNDSKTRFERCDDEGLTTPSQQRYIKIGQDPNQMQEWWNRNKYPVFTPRTLDAFVAQ